MRKISLKPSWNVQTCKRFIRRKLVLTLLHDRVPLEKAHLTAQRMAGVKF
jgi:hypothetical protein